MSESDLRNANAPRRHALYGRLRGRIAVAPGTDLTEPADPDWAERASSPQLRLPPGR